LAPERRASDNPMAIACFGFVTFLPLRPLFSLPRLNSCISRSTLFCALGPYFRPLDDFLFDDELPEDLDRDELRCEPDGLLPLFLAEGECDLCDRDDELDLLRDELFLRAVAMN
jgi:hypothetical protein